MRLMAKAKLQVCVRSKGCTQRARKDPEHLGQLGLAQVGLIG